MIDYIRLLEDTLVQLTNEKRALEQQLATKETSIPAD